MKTLTTLLFITISTLPLNAQNTTKVLFIGNSITYFNAMPQTFETISNSLGDSSEVTMYAPGGTGFVNHVVDANVYDHFREGNWDFVVLQPGSGESFGMSFTIEETLERARVLTDSIYKYNPCTKVLFHEISNGTFGVSATDSINYNYSMDVVKENIEFLCDSTESFFAPIGEALRTRWNSDLNDLLWGSYGDIHPNQKGSYIAACIFYSTIFQKSSQATTVLSSLSNQEADDIQLMCDTLFLDFFDDCRINTYIQLTDFNYVISTDTVNFINTSQNLDSVLWGFGDGSFSTELNPTHVYPNIGSFDVTLTTFKNGCEQIINKTVDVLTVNVKENELLDNWNIYPNPVTDKLYINTFTTSQNLYEIFNLSGQLLIKTNASEIPTSDLNPGLYILKRSNKEGAEVKSFIKR